jgi:hypothetical protein
MPSPPPPRTRTPSPTSSTPSHSRRIAGPSPRPRIARAGAPRAAPPHPADGDASPASDRLRCRRPASARVRGRVWPYIRAARAGLYECALHFAEARRAALIASGEAR